MSLTFFMYLLIAEVSNLIQEYSAELVRYFANFASPLRHWDQPDWKRYRLPLYCNSLALFLAVHILLDSCWRFRNSRQIHVRFRCLILTCFLLFGVNFVVFFAAILLLLFRLCTFLILHRPHRHKKYLNIVRTKWVRNQGHPLMGLLKNQSMGTVVRGRTLIDRFKGSNPFRSFVSTNNYGYY